jgi:hypothetical protein
MSLERFCSILGIAMFGTAKKIQNRPVLTRWWRQKIAVAFVDVGAVSPCAWWLTSPLGTPRGRYDECSG